MTVSQSSIMSGAPLHSARTVRPFDGAALFVLVALCILTMSSAAVLVGGIPRISILMVGFAAYMVFRLHGRVDKKFLQFALIYLAALVPGTIQAAIDDNVKFVSALQLLVMIGCFVVLASYVQMWLQRQPDAIKTRRLEFVFIGFVVFSVFEMNFYTLVTNLRHEFYRTQFTDLIAQIYTQRELILYGGRPTGFFSETSNFSRFMGLMVALYMTITRCSWRSLFALVFFLVLLRSVSYLFAAPAMVFALLQYPPQFGRRTRRIAVSLRRNIVVVLAVTGVIAVGVAATQTDRIASALQSTDGSFNARILFPATYMWTQSKAPIVGMGITPQDDVQEFTRQQQVIQERMVLIAGFNEGISATIVLLVGLGAIGLFLFFFGAYQFMGREGLVLAATFLLSNLLNSGYNSAAMFVPSAILLSLIVYQRRRRMIDSVGSSGQRIVRA
jgi:hypothetical protein